MRILLSILLILTVGFSNNIGHFAKKGEKVAKIFCDTNRLPKGAKDLSDALTKLKDSGACKDLSGKKLEWVAYYILGNHKESSSSSIDVPNGAKCPVCGMFVYKYPKWVAVMVVSGKTHYFDGVKDMMKYYFFDADFPYDRAKIEKMQVTNYYTLKAINAKDAIYVYDSKVFGPMGREFIPFSTKKEAKNFIADHGGELMEFKEITPKNTLALDGVEFEGN